MRPTKEMRSLESEAQTVLRDIESQIARCTKCKLGGGRARPVPGSGNPNARIMLVGEAPGFYEDQSGVPFVGPAGKLLDELLGVAGLNRKDVFITNVVKHRPPGNRDPEPDELDACDAYLRAQIAAIKPEIIVTLGRFSLGKFVQNVRAMRDVHGRAIPTEGGLTICAMYHPAAALHQGALRSVLEQDFRALPMMLARIQQSKAAASAAAPVQAALPGVERPPEQMSLF
jgi:DNA polymerase